MLNAHKAAALSGVRLLQTPRPIARDLYRLNPRGQLAKFLGCECDSLPVLVIGVDDARIRVSIECALHGTHPDQVQAYA
jgi:hypothetical protein